MTASQTGAEEEVDRYTRVQRAVQQWTRQLIDLTGHNQLLYYKTLKRGTLELTDADPDRLDALLGGQRIRLSTLCPSTDDQPDRAEDALRRARTLHKKAVDIYEEKGIQTLYVAWGMTTWTTEASSSTPNAPLLLSPLSISPRGASEHDFDLTIEGDWQVNETLLHLLRVEFEVDVDPSRLSNLLDQDRAGAPDPSELCDALAKEVDDVPDFEIVPRVVIGTFSYMKLPMVQDLQSAVEEMAENDLVAALAGVQEAQAALRARHAHSVSESDPDRTPPDDEFLVHDADASQSYAINAAVAGEPLVVQGPPGTGKSQTIANLIATFAARGKRVLFVAEKRAAIDAVVKRLEQKELSDLVFDLHGGSRSKRQIAQDLARNLETFGSIPKPDLGDLHHQLTSSRDQLVAYEEALHARREPWELSLWDVLEQLLNIGGRVPHLLSWSGASLQGLDAETVRSLKTEIHEWQGLARPLIQGTTPWVETTVRTEAQALEAIEEAQEVVTTWDTARRALESVLQETGLPEPETLDEWGALLDLLESIEETGNHFDSALWNDNLQKLAAELDPARRSSIARLWAHLRRPAYRRAKKQARQYCTQERAIGTAELAARIVAAANEFAEWQARGGHAPPSAPASTSQAATNYNDLQSRLTHLQRAIPLPSIGDQSLSNLPAKLDQLVSDDTTLLRIPRVRELEARFAEHGCQRLVAAVYAGQIDPSSASQAFLRSWLESLRKHYLAADRRLANFDGDLQRERAARFIDAERLHIETTPRRVWRHVAEHAVSARNAHPEQDATVTKQARLKRGHMPLRRLVESAPDVLLSLRPCWAMSPLMVSQALPHSMLFDVVIFDEASQVQPADAVPALARAEQAIVAGDSRQLPPTRFFDSTVEGDDEEEDEEGLTAGFESILDVLGTCLRERMLRWHYRSHDERLIAFSNYHLYDGLLVTFPGAAAGNCLTFETIPHRTDKDVDSKSNDDEVEQVVDLIIEHARQRPLDSLGVIALGSHHSNRIHARLRERLHEETDPDLDDFLDETYEDRTFVKNLERVQGDERDAIILTTGYSKGRDGRLRYHFGPINQEGGERRLNVAVTRARKQLTVVSSFAHTDMTQGKGSVGAQLLRSYLKYVASGGSDLDGAEAKWPLNAFEVSVKTRLEQAGLEVIPQYGTSGYRIDFAVPHPSRRERMVLAIEADGASYHSSPTARDRDRLRQEVLERLGWTFHRIWSTDWFNNPEAETAKVVEAFEQAVAWADEEDEGWEWIHDQDDEESESVSERVPAPELSTKPKKQSRERRPAVAPRGKINEYSHKDLVALTQWIISDTLLRTDEEVVEELMDELGFQRRGKRIMAALAAAVRDARGNKAAGQGSDEKNQRRGGGGQTRKPSEGQVMRERYGEGWWHH